MKYNKFITTALSASLVASAIVPVASAANFSDVEGNTHADAIKALADQGIVNGYTDGTFKPNTEINRGQTVKLLGRWLETQGYKIPDNWDKVQRFNDLPVTAEAELVKYAALVKDAGVFNGSNGNLNYNEPMQRQQMALVFVRAIDKVLNVDLVAESKAAKFKSNMKDLNQAFADENRDAIVALEFANITVVENFNPTNTVTRGQFASFLYRTINHEANAELKVMSVEALNSTAIQIEFSQPIDKNEDNLKQVRVTKKANAQNTGELTYTLSEDGKVLTISTDIKNNQFFKGDYIVAIDDKTLKGANEGEYVPVYNQTVNFSDETSPTFVVERASAKVYKVIFTEPVRLQNIDGKNILGEEDEDHVYKINFEDKDGNVIKVAAELNEEQNVMTLRIPDSAVAGVELTAKIRGVLDIAGNVMSPNPADIKITKGEKDGSKPIVEGEVVQTGAKTFTFKVSETLAEKPEVKYGKTTDKLTAVDLSNVNVDKNDPTLYHVTMNNVLESGAYYVVISNLEDLSGEVTEETTKVVNYQKDEVAPKAVSTEIVKGKDNKEYLEVTFDKNVELAGDVNVTAKGEAEKDGVTKEITASTSSLSLDQNNQKVIRIELAKLLADGNDMEGADYDVTLTFSNVNSEFGVAVQAADAKFTRGNDRVEEAIKVVDVRPGSDNNTVVVEFDQEVDGVSAKNTSNYQIDNAIVKSAVVKADNTKVVYLTLEEDSNVDTGNRYVTISGVKAKGSALAMETQKLQVNLTENVAPFVKNAELNIGKNELTITFSENIKLNDSKVADFEVLVDGKAKMVTDEEGNLKKLEIDVNDKAEGENATTVTLTLTGLTAEDVLKTITLAGLSDSDITDVNGNKVKFQEEITVTKK